MAHKGNIRRLLWRGDYIPAVEQLRPQYWSDPIGKFVPWMSALYSARMHRRYRTELMALLPRAVEHVERTIGMNNDPDPMKVTDAADVISTVFEFASRRPEVPEQEQKMYLLRAHVLLLYAIQLARRLPAGNHTLPLLLLTQSRVLARIGFEDLGAGGMALAEAMNLAPGIQDPMQRERVYRKAGLELRKRGRWGAGYRYGIRALLVPHGARGVKLKSLAALAGIGS